MSRKFKAGKLVKITPAQQKARELNWLTYRLKGLQANFYNLEHLIKKEVEAVTTDPNGHADIVTYSRLEYQLTKARLALTMVETDFKHLSNSILEKLKEKNTT